MSSWIDYKKYIPHSDVEIFVTTAYNEQVRKAIFRRWQMSYTFTDCTHPMQNCYLDSNQIIKWKFVNEQDLLDGKLFTNHYAREKEGEEILKSIPRKTFFNSIYQLFIKQNQ